MSTPIEEHWWEMTSREQLPDSTGVLAVCAHPDDESFGLGAVIASYTARGTPLDLVCLTRGEASSLGAGTTPALDRTRAEELATAVQALDIRTLALHAFPDGALDHVPLRELASCVSAGITASTDILLVFDDTGITGHPDHQHATRAALVAADDLDLAVLAWTLPERVARILNAELHTAFVGRAPGEIDLHIPVDRARQWDAIRCHRSQLADNPVPARRLALTGATEFLRYLRRRGEAATSTRTHNASPEE